MITFSSKSGRLVAMAVLLASFFVLAPARGVDAQVILSIGNYSPATPTPGSTGNQFDVLITNTGSPVTVGFFAFQLQVAPLSGITFTNVVRPASGYLFGAYNPPEPLSLDTFPNTTFTASDPADLPTPPAVTLNTGSSFKLGQVTYSVGAGVSPGAMIPVNFIAAGTSLDNGLGNAVPFTTQPGQITVDAVPEPSTLAIGAVIAGVAGVVCLRQHRAGKRRAAVASDVREATWGS